MVGVNFFHVVRPSFRTHTNGYLLGMLNILRVLLPFIIPVGFCICIDSVILTFISSPEPKAHGELIVYQSSRRLCVCVFTHSNMKISETLGPTATKFYLKHHWIGGKDALGFGPDRI